MPDRPRPVPPAAPRDLADDAEGADRESRVEQLLLAGLDQYFAGQYEQAIDVWTRVAFLDRRNSRAKAYIDRARGLVAEQQREVEALVQEGVAAYQAGDLANAKTLLTRAVRLTVPMQWPLPLMSRPTSALSMPSREWLSWLRSPQ